MTSIRSIKTDDFDPACTQADLDHAADIMRRGNAAIAMVLYRMDEADMLEPDPSEVYSLDKLRADLIENCRAGLALRAAEKFDLKEMDSADF